MRKFEPLACLSLALGLLSLSFGMWAFRKISDFFFRCFIMIYNRYLSRLYDYMATLVHEGWAVRDFLVEFLAPSLIALTMAVLASVAIKRRANAAPKASVGYAALRFSRLCLLLGGFDTVVLVLIYSYSFYRYSGFF